MECPKQCEDGRETYSIPNAHLVEVESVSGPLTNDVLVRPDWSLGTYSFPSVPESASAIPCPTLNAVSYSHLSNP